MRHYCSTQRVSPSFPGVEASVVMAGPIGHSYGAKVCIKSPWTVV